MVLQHPSNEIQIQYSKSTQRSTMQKKNLWIHTNLDLSPSFTSLIALFSRGDCITSQNLSNLSYEVEIKVPILQGYKEDGRDMTYKRTSCVPGTYRCSVKCVLSIHGTAIDKKPRSAAYPSSTNPLLTQSLLL